MKEYIEFNNVSDKKALSMISIRNKSNQLQYVSMDFRRTCMGLPVIRSLKNFKTIKIPLSEKENAKISPLKISPLSDVKEKRSTLINYSKYFDAIRKYELCVRYSND